MSVLVDQAASLTGSAVKASSLPSGENAYSFEPPNGAGGVFTSSFGVRSFASPVVASATNRWLPLALVPAVPVADHQVVEDADLALGRLLLLVLRGGLLGGLAGIDLGGEGDLVPLRRPDRAGDVDRQLGELPRLAAVERAGARPGSSRPGSRRRRSSCRRGSSAGGCRCPARWSAASARRPRPGRARGRCSSCRSSRSSSETT